MRWEELLQKQVTQHFHMRELIPQHQPSDLLISPQIIYPTFERLLTLLERYREKYNTPFIITSALRTPSTNWSPWSYHLFAMAVDFYPKNLDVIRELARELYKDWEGGCGWYPDQTFIHVDIGYKRRWKRVNGIYTTWDGRL